MKILEGFLGTYESEESQGVYRFTLDLEKGELSHPTLYLRAADAKYLSLRKGLLAGPVQEEGRAGIFLKPAAWGKAAAKNSVQYSFQEKTTACFVTQDEERIYTANYHEGSIMIYRKEQGSPVPDVRIETGAESGCHQVLLCGRYLLAVCLLRDRIYLYDRLNNWSLAGEIPFPLGTGPRHGVLDKRGERLFVVSELSNQVFLFRMERAGEGKIDFHPVFSCQIPVKKREDQEPPASAAIRLSPDERFLYISTRFSDVITCFLVDNLSLSVTWQINSGGKGPRDFVITEDGRYLLAVNRSEGGLVLFRLYDEIGRMGQKCFSVLAPQAVSVVLQEEKV